VLIALIYDEKLDRIPSRKRKKTPEIDAGYSLDRLDTPWKIGAHVSAAGGVENSVVNASSIGYLASMKW
jgi:AP endonuclease-1